MFKLTDDTAFILGTPMMICANIANQLRELGHEIEEEPSKQQAYVIHWFLIQWEMHGSNWREKAQEQLQKTQGRIVTQEQKIVIPD